MSDGRADEKRGTRGDESSRGGGEREGRGAALGGILFGQPQRVDREVRAAESEDDQGREEPLERMLRQK